MGPDAVSGQSWFRCSDDEASGQPSESGGFCTRKRFVLQVTVVSGKVIETRRKPAEGEIVLAGARKVKCVSFPKLGQ